MVLRCLKLTYHLYIRLHKLRSTVVGYLKLVVFGRARIGRGVSVAGLIRVKVFPGGRLIIGDGVRFQSGFRYNPVGSESVTGIWVGPKGTLDIGAEAGMSGTTLVCMEKVTIGRGTLIGGGTRIYDTDFHALTPEKRKNEPGNIPTKPVVIGSDCFIGGYCMILKGVTIGDGAVVGAGSVVAKDIPAGQIWAGNPARLIRCTEVRSDKHDTDRES